MALVPADLMTEYAAKVLAREEEKGRVEAELARAEGKAGPSVEEVLRAVEEDLDQLRTALLEDDPAAQRLLLGELVSKVELHFDHVHVCKGGKGKTRSIFRRGVIF